MVKFLKLDKKVPIIEFFKIKKNFDRVNPVTWIFLFSVVFVVLGFAFEIIRIFVWMGGFLLFIFIGVFFVIFWGKLKG